MIAVPDLQMQFAGQFVLDLAPGKERYLPAYYHHALALRVRGAKYESPVEVALAVQGTVVDVGLLVIVVGDPPGTNLRKELFSDRFVGAGTLGG